MILETPQSHLPDGTREYTFLIYDSKTGEIVHGHKEVLLPGLESPSTDVVNRRALEYAAQIVGRSISSLKVLASDFGELRPGTRYCVDVKSGRVQAVSTEELLSGPSGM